MTTSQQFLITATVDGRPLGTFDTASGGEPTADVAKHRPGGMVGENSYGALPTYGDLTVGRELDRVRDVEVYRSLVPRVGRALASVSKQPLDDDGAPAGKPFTYTGRLAGMSDPDADSNDASVSMWQMTIVVTGRA
ncbi:hypothetical protein [Nocardioides sp.]|uniref:hypothetical protein n=1 Tax=Nocardioides sp. TaxID=35761 RepID=UPI002624046F|nr:hypothetical protein [Nocardioides sp.]MDI6911481.1 hypothetical protein [Nocardioides sp.]